MRHPESTKQDRSNATGKYFTKTEHLKGIKVQLRRSYEPPALIPLVGPLDNKVKDSRGGGE